MKSVQSWFEQVSDKKTNEECCIWDLCFNTDGSRLIAAAGNRVLVYDANNGTLLHSLKGHSDSVLCVTCSRDGCHFASGSADKYVIIWDSQMVGKSKFANGDAVQCMSCNPINEILLVCTSVDLATFGFDDQKVNRTKINSRVTCCSWTSDGQYFAVGFYSGIISIRSKTLDEKNKIDRSVACPIWDLEWSPNREGKDILAVVDWSQKLSFYLLSGSLVGKEKQLDFDPCCVSWFGKGEYLIISGSNKQCMLYSKDGIKLGTVAELKSWAWTSRVRPDSNAVAIGCQDGVISFNQVILSTIHALFRDRYIYRDYMTDVVIHHLVTDEKVRIKCRELVKKVSTYKNKLAVQLPDKFIIYEVLHDDANDMKYKVREKFAKKIDCYSLVVCAQHIVLCLEKRLQCLSFKGVKHREWVLESPIKYIRVMGGPPGREGLLTGLRNGQILQVFLDNPFPVQILKINTSMRCLDLNTTRKRLAVVDEHNTCLVYDVKTKELQYQEPNADSVAWNNRHEDMLCFSGNGLVNIKAANYPVHQQKIQGFVVGFSGSSIYCLNGCNMTMVDVPQSAPMYQYLEKKLFKETYNVACLGVTNGDWETLGQEALESLDFQTSAKAFIRIRDIHKLDLIQDIEDRKKRGESNMQVFLGHIYAIQGRFQEAAKLYSKAGQPSRALTMYTDLCMFDFAKEFVGAEDVKEKQILMSKQADWASNLNEPKSAAEMYINAGEFGKAIEIMGEHGWADMLIDLARSLDKADRDSLSKCANYLRKMEQYAYASEVYAKIGDTESLILLHVDAKLWDEAFSLVKKHPEYKSKVYFPYAQWLAENDKFEESQMAFHKAGLEAQAVRVLEQLTNNAVSENRFNDAGFYFWKLSMQCLDLAGDDSAKSGELLKKFRDYQQRAEIYYAYHSVQRSTDEPFTSHQPEALFNISRFLIHSTVNHCPAGISKVAILYSLAKQSKILGALKMAHHAYAQLQKLRIPVRFQDTVDLGSLVIKPKPFHDHEDLLPMCYRCSSTNPLLNLQGNFCSNCRQPFVYSFISFEVLPLIEFFLDDDVTDNEAVSLLELEPPMKKEKEKWNKTTASQSMQMDDYALMDDNTDDPFNPKFMSFEQGGVEYQPVKANRNVLKSLSRTEVIICQWPKPLRNQYFKVIMPDVPLTKCSSCNKIFHKDDYELLALQENRCPYCRKSLDD